MLLTAFINICWYVDCCMLVRRLPSENGIFFKYWSDSLAARFSVILFRLFKERHVKGKILQSMLKTIPFPFGLFTWKTHSLSFIANFLHLCISTLICSRSRNICLYFISNYELPSATQWNEELQKKSDSLTPYTPKFHKCMKFLHP